jgi:hypothetical protein
VVLSCIQTDWRRSHFDRCLAGTQARLLRCHKNVYRTCNCKLLVENCFLMALQTRTLKASLCSEANDFSPRSHKNNGCVKPDTLLGNTRCKFNRADAWNLRLTKPRLDWHSYTSGGRRDTQMSGGWRLDEWTPAILKLSCWTKEALQLSIYLAHGKC